MGWDQMSDWLRTAPLVLVGVAATFAMSLAVGAGMAARTLSDRRDRSRDAPSCEGLEAVIVSAILGLLALLMAFTFSMVLNRFEDRRDLVLQEANAIGTAYLRAQLLEEPHRARLSGLLSDYTDNRLALGKARAGSAPELLARNDRMVTDLWAATTAAVGAIEDSGLTGPFLAGMNAVIDLDTARKVARTVQAPAQVYAVVLVFLIVATAMLGYLSTGRRGKVALAFMILLLSLTLMLILDIDRPTGGGIREDQMPMEQLSASLKAQPPAVFDRYLAKAGAR